MNKPTETYGLRCPDGREAQLLSVQVQAEILGLMLRLTVRQTWRNASGAPMATRLSFPLDSDQTLLDLQVQRPQGTQKLDKVWRESRTGCSATPGILATGEQVTLQWRLGQLLNLQGGSLRLPLPAGLVPRAARAAQIHLEVHDPVAQGTVGCATHNMHKVRHANGVSLSLHAPNGLEKDLLLTVHGLRDTAFALASNDAAAAGHCTVLMSASPRLPSQLPRPLRLKLLVDSSSAMAVDKLSQIRAALDKWLAQCLPEDQLSYSRFGERTVHDLPRLQVCTEAYQRRVRALARHTDTDLGRPDPLAALLAALAIPDEDEEVVSQADILLITASPLWQVEAPLRALRAAGHRLHVMAIGDAGEGLWRELAEASGGAFELLGPGQRSEQALARLGERLRQQHPVHPRLQIEQAEVCAQGQNRTEIADGDTLHLWALVHPEAAPHDLTGRPQLAATLHWEAGDAQARDLRATAVPWDEQGDLARVCAARDMPDESDVARQAHIARHGLLVPDSSRLAATAAPAGMATSAPPVTRPAMPTPAPALAATAQATPDLRAASAPPSVRPLRSAAPRHTDLAGWLGDPAAAGNPLTTLVNTFNTQSQRSGQFRAALSGTLQQVSTPLLNGIVLQLARRAGNPGRVWAMVLHWLHAEHDMPLGPQAWPLLEQELASVPVAVRSEVRAALALAAQPVVARQAA